MWKEEGFRGFMKGNGINVVRVCPVREPLQILNKLSRYCPTRLYSSRYVMVKLNGSGRY